MADSLESLDRRKRMSESSQEKNQTGGGQASTRPPSEAAGGAHDLRPALTRVGEVSADGFLPENPLNFGGDPDHNPDL